MQQSTLYLLNGQHSPSVGYVAHPQGSAADVRKAVGIIGRFANGVYLTTISDKDKDQEVGYHTITWTVACMDQIVQCSG
jgi:hypothetical protein